MASQNLFNGFNVVGNAVANTVTANLYYVGTGNVIVDNYGNLSNILSINSSGNIKASNALTTTNIFANTLTLSNAINVTGTIYASNALTTTNLFATTINLTGNLYASNALTTTNLFATTINLTNNLYASNALQTTDMFANTLTLSNATSVINVIGTVTATTLYGALAGSNSISGSAITAGIQFSGPGTGLTGTATGLLAGGLTGNPSIIVGNVYSANALTTTNIFANTMTLSNATASITGNLYVSNAIQTTNVSGARFGAGGFAISAGGPTMGVTGNIYASNAVQTTNVVASGNVAGARFGAGGFAISAGGPTMGVTGNIYASNAVQTTNVVATQFASVGGFAIAAGGPTMGVTGNIYASNALTTTNLFSATINVGTFLGSFSASSGLYSFVGSKESPASVLNVTNGSGGPTPGYIAQFSSGIGTALVITSSKSVGVGTSTPTANLHVVGNVFVSNAIQTTNINFSTATLGVAAPGELLYNTYLYSTLNTTSGRGSVPVQQIYKLSGTPASNTSTGTNFYFFSSLATTSTTAINLEAASIYDIEMHCYFAKVTGAGTVTWTLVASSAPTLMSGYYTANPITGIGSGTPTTGYAASAASTTAAFSATGSLSVANHSFLFKIQVITNLATTFDIQAQQSVAGLTPIVGSYYRVTKIADTTGSYV